jgi:hypothetical protein
MTTFTIKTDAGLMKGIEADDFDAAVRVWAKSEGLIAEDETEYTLADWIDYIEDIEGAWGWVENNDTYERHYAAQENMA